ncbi:MAG: hypothetical protein DWQ44_04870 [Bacteroidetes bacterium]|nr:MAG: hypothetical protein DWQ33_10920 [Bacteroidota bacterium]REK00602.1 MAG: hypothetical protein DWQ39_10595 [Bacteroidota bacterium]REK35276.1 MAG: hypothetical protein DWQ44_04870 [Bacteroidota bacterium]REK48352.1 MAG: hypothetical protein DWQ48_11070 [Bacteroidota bacterium]
MLLWGRGVFGIDIWQGSSENHLWNLLIGVFHSLPSWLNTLIMASMISFQAIYFNLVLNKHEVLYRNSYLPSLFFVLCISSFSEFIQVHPAHFVNLIMIRVFDKCFSMFKNEKAMSEIFDCGFLISIAVLLYFPAVLFVLVPMSAIVVLRAFNMREYIVLITGLALPFFFVSVAMFWGGNHIAFWNSLISGFRNPNYSLELNLDNATKAVIYMFAVMLLLSLIRIRKNYYKNAIRTRSYQQIIFFYLLLAITTFVFVKGMVIAHLPVLSIPAGVLLAYFFLTSKKRPMLTEVLFWTMCAIIAWSNFSV